MKMSMKNISESGAPAGPAPAMPAPGPPAGDRDHTSDSAVTGASAAQASSNLQALIQVG
jgi:hypothetical protein